MFLSYSSLMADAKETDSQQHKWVNGGI